MEKLNVGILIFDGVEVLDFAGPFEVFSRTRLVPGVEARRLEESAPFNVFLVAKSTEAIRAIADLCVLPRFSFGDTPPIDILVVPGGYGTRALLHDQEILSWIRRGCCQCEAYHFRVHGRAAPRAGWATSGPQGN